MKSLNELASDLKNMLKENMTANTGKSKENYGKCNNLKLEMRPELHSEPHVVISFGISEGIYLLSSKEKLSGSLGPEDRYVARWLSNSVVITNLRQNWDAKAAKGSSSKKHR